MFGLGNFRSRQRLSIEWRNASCVVIGPKREALGVTLVGFSVTKMAKDLDLAFAFAPVGRSGAKAAKEVDLVKATVFRLAGVAGTTDMFVT